MADSLTDSIKASYEIDKIQLDSERCQQLQWRIYSLF